MFTPQKKDSDKQFQSGSNKYNGVYEGVVKDNSDFQRMGRLSIWIPELGTREDDISGWVLASYCTPFGGATDPSLLSDEQTQTYEGTQRSYGFWAVPPDRNNRVVVMFLNGEVSRPIWIGCMYQQYTNSMVPNVPANKNYQYGESVPTAEFNRKSGSPYEEIAVKPYNKKSYESIRNQGLSEDKIRGFSQHGATSSPTPSIYGLLTPSGHYWSMEDTDGDQKIRMRSSNGAQILLDDTRSIVYIVNQKGNGWIEIDTDGKLMAYSEGGIGFRTDKDISFIADRDIIMDAGRNIISKSKDNIFVETGNLIEKVIDIHSCDVGEKRQETINEETKYVMTDISVKVDRNFNVGSLNINLNAEEYNNFTSNRDTNINATEDMNIASAGIMNIVTKETMNQIARDNIIQYGKKIIQNTGGSGVSPEAAEPVDITYSLVPERPSFERKDSYQMGQDDGTLYRKVKTVASVYPSHEPCEQHGRSASNRDEESTSPNNSNNISENILKESILVNKGNFMESLLDDLRRHEGVIYKVYSDPIHGSSAPTAGVGHLLSESEKKQYSIGDIIEPYQVEKWFIEDVQEAISDCERLYGGYWNNFPGVVKSILANMAFNLGYGGLSNFVKMNAAVKNNDWKKASIEMRNSLWYSQTGNRSRELTKRMEDLA